MSELIEATPAMWSCCAGWLYGASQRAGKNPEILGYLLHLHYQGHLDCLEQVERLEQFIRERWPPDLGPPPTIQDFFRENRARVVMRQIEEQIEHESALLRPLRDTGSFLL